MPNYSRRWYSPWLEKMMKETPKELTRWKLYLERHGVMAWETSKVPPPWISRVHFRYASRNAREGPLNFGMHRVAQNSRMLTKHLSVRVTSSLQLLRGCNDSFERRAASSARSGIWRTGECSYQSACLSLGEILDLILALEQD